MQNVLWLLIITYPIVVQSSAINFSLRTEPSSYNTQKVAYLYAHSLRSTQKQAFWMSRLNKEKQPNNRWILDDPLIMFDFPDATYDDRLCDKNEVNLGQERDIERLAHAYESALNQLPKDTKIVLCGVSRGAATALNFAALYKPKNLAALIIDSAFDRLESVILHLLRRFYIGWLPFSQKLGMKIVHAQFPLLSKYGAFPLNIVEKIDPQIPILLVHSKMDDVIPLNSPRKLYVRLKETGHEDVYLVELASGKHAKLLRGTDGQYYMYITHAFYKKHGLPYNPDFAKRGEPFLSRCQPSIDSVKAKIVKRNNEFDDALIYVEEEDDE